MRIVHPNLPGQVCEVPDSVYIDVLRYRDWAEAPDPFDTGGSTVGEVLSDVGEDPQAAAAALESERGGRQRSTLIEPLERIAGSSASVPTTPADGGKGVAVDG